MSESIKLVFHNTFSNRSEFEMQSGTRPWDLFLILKEGSFRCTIDGESSQIEKDEIAYFPRNTFFERSVISPIGFHQFGFFITEQSEYTRSLTKGKLSVPHAHVRALIDLLDLSPHQTLPQSQDFFIHVLHHLIYENHLYDLKKRNLSTKRDNDVAFAVQYMSEHIAEKINTEELAARLHLSRVGLIMKFKKHMGCTPADFLIRLRMQYAKHLLLEGNTPINEIARLCGYHNAYYFSNAFKHIYHTSPLHYRQTKRKATQESKKPISDNEA